MRRNFLICLIALFTTAASAQQPSFVTDSLDAYIRQGLKDWNIPGLAIAVVKDGQVVVMKGYGVRDVKTKAPVDEHTLFMIASNSKLFTGTALAQLEYDKQLSLDDKITKYFPDFTLYDPHTTALVTIKDMLSHHLGTKTFQGDFTFWNSAISRDEIMHRMRLLPPSQQFRQSYGYCNSCFLTAGEVIPKVTGKPWEVYIYDSIVAPLGMEHTHTLSRGMERMPNAARPYTTGYTGVLTPLPYDQVDNLAPAGSIVSCASDVARWLMLQLDSGKFEGRQILPWPVLRKTRDVVTMVSSRKSATYPMHFTGYGLGVFTADYNGRQIYWHTGGADGFVTNTCFVPEERLGITILTNNDNQSFFEALRYQLLDAYLGMPWKNRSQAALSRFLAGEKETNNEIKGYQARVKGKPAPLPLRAYAGTYENELYGPVTITAEKKGLVVHFPGHQSLTAAVQYMDNDEWLLSWSNPAYGIFPLKFTVTDGKVVSTQIKVNDFLEYDPYTFTKKD